MAKRKGSPSTWFYTEEGRDNHDRTFGKKPQTMNDKYGDGSDHAVCEKCGWCIECGDCKDFGCGADKEEDHGEREE